MYKNTLVQYVMTRSHYNFNLNTTKGKSHVKQTKLSRPTKAR